MIVKTLVTVAVVALGMSGLAHADQVQPEVARAELNQPRFDGGYRDVGLWTVVQVRGDESLFGNSSSDGVR